MTLAPFPAAQCIDFAALLGQDRHEGPCSHMYPAAEAVVVAVVVAVTVTVAVLRSTSSVHLCSRLCED